jgi:hypothetical protein
MKRFVVLLGLGMLGSVAAATGNRIDAPAEPAALVITAKPVPLNKDNPKQMRVGELVYRGGVELRSANRNFGGISDFRLVRDTFVLAVSDTGSWISFKLVEKKNRLLAVKGIAIAPILDGAGTAGIKKDRDAEGLAVLPDKVLVSVEGSNSVWVFPPIDPEKPASLLQKAVAILSPDSWKLWPVNGGPEAYDVHLKKSASAATPQGFMSFVLAEDSFSADGSTAGELEDEGIKSVRYMPPAEFKPTALAITGEGSALVLHRFFSPSKGVAASIATVEDFTGDAVLSGREIARLAPPLTVDNMEGIAYVERGGRKYIYLVSDDNFSGLQRTLLLKFEWQPAQANEKKPAG